MPALRSELIAEIHRLTARVAELEKEHEWEAALKTAFMESADRLWDALRKILSIAKDELGGRYTADKANIGQPSQAVHADPTGKTREPPHCPTCDCDLGGAREGLGRPQDASQWCEDRGFCRRAKGHDGPHGYYRQPNELVEWSSNETSAGHSHADSASLHAHSHAPGVIGGGNRLKAPDETTAVHCEHEWVVVDEREGRREMHCRKCPVTLFESRP